MKKKYWLPVVLILILGGGYFLFGLGYDVYEERRRTAPARQQQARLARLNREIEAFAENSNEPVPSGVEMLSWEHQSGEAGAGRNRLTLWADGRSEARVYPGFFLQETVLQPEQGWQRNEEGDTPCFVRNPAYARADAQNRFRNAFKLGIHLLEPAQRNYPDASGVVVGVQTNGVLREQVFLEFEPEDQHFIRFQALRRILGEFDLEPNAFRVGPQQQTGNAANARVQPDAASHGDGRDDE